MGDFVTFAVSIALGVVGVGLLGFFLWVLAAPCFGWLRGSKDLRRLRRAAERVKRFDSLVNDEKFRPALSELRAAVIYDAPSLSEIISSYREHYQNLLSRMLLVAEELNKRPEGLPDVERLLFERVDLMTLQIKVNDTFRKLRAKRTNEGKDLPSWSKEDFEKRLAEVKQELSRNQAHLEDHLKLLFAHLEKPSGEDQIVYH